MATKIESALDDAQFAALCEQLRALPRGERTYRKIAELVSREHGVDVSLMGVQSFVKGPFARYVERAQRARETTEALVAATRGAVHPLDAIEEAAVIELQDELTGGAEVDLKRVIGLMSKLRLSISMREESRRKQADLERRLDETAKRLSLADAQMRLRDEQIAKLTAEREERADKARRLQEAIAEAKKGKGSITRETLERIEQEAKLL